MWKTHRFATPSKTARANAKARSCASPSGAALSRAAALTSPPAAQKRRAYVEDVAAVLKKAESIQKAANAAKA